MRITRLVLLILLFPIQLTGQGYSLQQEFSPNAAELGKYGKVPVSYFNGLPNISIPLTELRAKDYTLPVYLTYYAGGNKPEQHPGWAGLGWTLHAGGCINRIVNGLKDEMDDRECSLYYAIWSSSTDPGNYYRSSITQGTDWGQSSVLSNFFGTSNGTRLADYAPDEFQVNIDDISASFYITGEGEVKIVSKGFADFSVDIRVNTDEDNVANQNGTLSVYHDSTTNLDLKAKLFHYIDRIILTKSDGTKYYFGGDQSSIEFSVVRTSPTNTEWEALGAANTWMLTKIERPNGEVISFAYEHDGVPIVRHDGHRVEVLHYANGTYYRAVDTFYLPSTYHTYSYAFIIPSYLTNISSLISQDAISFQKETSVELKDPFRETEFLIAIGNNDQGYSGSSAFSPSYMWARNVYKRLKSITGVSGKQIVFHHSNTSLHRLHLDSLDVTWTNDTNPKRYRMAYNNTALPAYGSKMLDAWGYYNGMVFGQTAQDTVNINYKRTLIDSVLLRAEMLTRITYPTGGYSEFEYEPHQYGKIAVQFPFSLEQTSGYAGGLRIRKIKDFDGETLEERSFDYSLNGQSSGILSGRPIFRVFGELLSSHVTGHLWGFENVTDHNHYEIYQEDPLFQLSTTDGNHVTYSHVKEHHSDGGWTEYNYTNHDTPGCLDTLPVNRYENVTDLILNDAFTSKNLRRGLLCNRNDYSASEGLIREETNTYAHDESEFIKSVIRNTHCGGLWERFSYIKVFCYHPFLLQSVVKTYSDNGSYILETTGYEYDVHRNLIRTIRTTGNQTEIQTIRYPADISGGIYPSMASAHFLDRPVERTLSRDGKLVQADLVTYKENSGLYVPSERYQVKPEDGFAAYTFTPYDGQSIWSRYRKENAYVSYDSLGNLLESQDRDGVPTTYQWDSRGDKIAAVFVGATNRDRIRYTRGTASHTETDSYVNADPAEKTFSCAISGPFNFAFTPSDTTYGLTAKLDGTYYAMQHVGNGAQGFSSSVNISAGSHTLDVYCTSIDPPFRGDKDLGIRASGDPIVTYPLTGSLSVSWPQSGAVAGSANGTDCFFEDFEVSGGSAGYGFHSNKGRTSPYTRGVSVATGRTYILDYMQRVSGVWQYVRSVKTSSTGTLSLSVAASASKPIDHVRFYPVDSAVSSYTWWPTGELRCKVDGTGYFESYEYDALGRLVTVKDADGNSIKHYTYHYEN